MAQQQSHAAALACKLVRELHGDITEKVACHLVAKGLQPLPDIMRGTQMPPGQVKQALLLLLQHNYAVAYLHKEDEGIKNARPPYHLYAPCLDRMLQIIRYPRFLLHIKEEMGEEAERIVEILLHQGRLSLDQIIQAVAGRLGQEVSEVQERVRNVFMSLVQSHYIERCPVCLMPPPRVAPHPASIKGRKAAGAGKAGGAAQAADQARAVRSMDEALFDKNRFKLPQELIISIATDAAADVKPAAADGGEEADGADGETAAVATTGPGGKRGAAGAAEGKPAAKKARIKAGTAAAAAPPTAAAVGSGAKGAEEAAAAAAATAAAAAAAVQPAVLLWRVNAEEFNRRFRHRCCVSVVAERRDMDAGHVLAAMLTASRPLETRLREDRSTPLSMDEIVGTANRLMETGVLPRIARPVTTLITEIATDAMELISHHGHGPGGEQFVVNMSRIIQLAQIKQLEATIKEKFGAPGMRVFRMLMIKGQLEQKQVADFSMLSPKDTRELLYKMLKAGYLALQDIPRSNDRAPSRTLYTWRVEVTAATSRLGAELYGAAARVWSRIRHEMWLERDLLELVEESKAKGEMHFTLTTAQRAAAHRLKRVVDTLETALLQLDEMIAILNEF